MIKEAWVLQLKPEVAKEDYDGEVLFLTDSEESCYAFLTKNLQAATLIFDKEKEIEFLKAYEKKCLIGMDLMLSVILDIRT